MATESIHRDFSSYLPDDDVRTLGDGVLYEVADTLNVDIGGDDPDPAKLPKPLHSFASSGLDR